MEQMTGDCVVKKKAAGAALRGAIYTTVAVLAIYLSLVMPNRIEMMKPLYFLRLPLEFPLLLLLFAISGRFLGVIFQWFVGLALALIVVGKVADIATFSAFGRPFNPVFDYFMFLPALELLTGAVGQTFAIAIFVLAALVALFILLLAVYGVARLARLVRGKKLAFAIIAIVLLAGWTPLWLSKFSMAQLVQTATMSTTTRVIDMVKTALESTKDLSAFAEAAKVDDFRDYPSDKLLTALKGKDVLVVFIESYGATVLENPLYVPSITDVLKKGDARMKAAGIESRSAFLTSPTMGGISWLAHGSFLSGLWVDNQRRYESLVVSDRMTLNKAFQKAGWRTVAVMPAIARGWPEGGFFGYDKIYAASDLGYKGLPFNWVTMPDQYVLSAFDRLERTVTGRKPIMAEFALISSHAPWTPIPKLVDWSEVGDGSIFNEQATSGDSPAVVWADPDRVREQFRQSIAYALDNLTSYAAHIGMKNTVIIAFGDHQPAPMITGDELGRDVPVHLITADADVLAAVDGWGWEKGMIPDMGAPIWKMNEMRDRILSTFSAK